MPTFLHVGCGPKRKDRTTPGFNQPEWTEVRLDIDPSARPDIVADMTDMSAVPSESMDGLFSSHNLEHLEAHRVPVALAEFRRVLKPGGFAVVTCPDLQMAAHYVAEGKLEDPIYSSPAGPISAMDILYGHGRALAEGKTFMAHRYGFSLRSLYDALRRAGFEEVSAVRRRVGLELWALALRSHDRARLDALAAEHLPTLTS